MNRKTQPRHWGGYAEVAYALSTPERPIYRQQVYMWWSRRERNQFPDRLLIAELSPEDRQAIIKFTDAELVRLPKEVQAKILERHVFDLDTVAEWYRTYVPSVGGRPYKQQRHDVRKAG